MKCTKKPSFDSTLFRKLFSVFTALSSPLFLVIQPLSTPAGRAERPKPTEAMLATLLSFVLSLIRP
jgi:hypothetical protein